ncbi:hypothetical protein Patl1_02468 [Pistacia atlantica]|uniref:Uncharacterized protein n=1 Tax=Pistacia atlantica TaxID=434234 RepID=A0ACC1C4Y2_9ROSI|nr:hypothetical protein Patl1_02468 [Pistacia atlantica]
MYSKFGQTQTVAALFGIMPRKNIMSCNILINAYMRSGDLESARKVFEDMPERNIATWNAMVAGLIQFEFNEEGLRLLSEMHQDGFLPDGFTLGSALRGCAGLRGLYAGRQVHGYLVKCGFEMDLVVGSSLAHIFLRMLSDQFQSDLQSLPSAWYNNNSVVTDGWKMRVFLQTKNANDVDYYCGFYCNGARNSYVFSVVAIGGGGNHTVVWSANRDRPVKANAMVQLTRGGLVLQDSDGTQVWSSNTSGSGNSIVGMNLNHSGNLVLFSNESDSIWDSPTEKISFTPPSSTPTPTPPSTQPAENGPPVVTNLAPPPGPPRGKGKKLVAVIAGSVAGVLVIVSVIIVLFAVRIRKTSEAEELVEDYIKQRLGGGGFGSVFEGDLPDGNKIAVKKLDRMGQGMREFLAEVETIVVCGRRNLDRSRSESSFHLLKLLQDKAEEGQVLDIMENSVEDMQNHREEMVRMIKIGAWCLQDDPIHRPSMSTVVKVLEGLMDVDENINYKFAHAMPCASLVNHQVSAPPVESILSNPR